jgi:hypothetical protein
MTDEERFFAWLDGELTASEAAEMEARVAADPHLRTLADEHRAFGADLRAAFDPVATAPVPDHLTTRLKREGKVIDIAQARRARYRPSAPQWAALAATLAVGIMLGGLVPRAVGPIGTEDNRLVATGDLGRALDVQLASAPAGDTRIGLTFRNGAGQICRSFTDRAASGLACHEDGKWQLKGIFAAPDGQASDYRMAAGMDPNLATLVDSTMSGEAFDAAAEKAARDRHWR